MQNITLPKGWKVDKLENLVSFTRGSEPGSDSYTEDNRYTRFLRVSDITGTSKEKVYTVANNLKKVCKGDLLITLDGTPGIISDKFEGAISSGIRKIDIIDDGLLQDYLKFYLKSTNVQRIIYKYTTGATILHASKSIQYISVIVPPLEIQKKIVETLECASKVLEKKKEAISLVDDLVKSQFIEMFGDPKENSKGWQVKKLGEIFKVGSSKRIYQREQTSSGIPFLRISDLVQRIETGNNSNELYISEEQYNSFKEKLMVPSEGDILITSRGTLGLCYIVKASDKFYFQDGMISWLKKGESYVNHIYITKLFNMKGFRKQIDEIPTGTTVNYLSISKLADLDIMYPNINLQNQFADFVKQVDKLKFEMEESLKELDNNFNSLMQKAFTGELF